MNISGQVMYITVQVRNPSFRLIYLKNKRITNLYTFGILYSLTLESPALYLQFSPTERLSDSDINLLYSLMSSVCLF